MVQSAFKKVVEALSDVPVEIREEARFSDFRRVLAGENREFSRKSLLCAGAYIFHFILHEERRQIDSSQLMEFVTLNILEFIRGVTLDKVFDDGKNNLLPLANILNRQHSRQAAGMGIEMGPVKDRFDLYYYNQVTLPVAEIEMELAKRLDREWQRVSEGFSTTTHIMDSFLERFELNRRWSHFYKWYLLHRQLLDDVADLPDDYKSGELKSFGILGLVMKYGTRRKIVNLKNPINSGLYQIYMILNYKKVYKRLIERFNSEMSDEFPVEEFYLLIERLKDYISSQF